MNLATFNVELDQEKIQQYVDEKLEETLHETLFYWDISEMSKRMCLSKSFLEQEILDDPRMRLLQRQKPRGKRVWPVVASLKVIEQIMDEW